MGRLTSLPPRLGRPAPRLASPRDEHGHSPVAEPWRRWYSTARWRRLRLEVFDRDLFTCRCGCDAVEGDTSKLVADHIVPHRGDPALFWDIDNLQTLRASPCHNSLKQAQEKRGALWA